MPIDLDRLLGGRYNSQRLSAVRPGGFGLPKALILGLLSLILAACAGAAEPLTEVGPFTNDPTVSMALVSIQGSAVTVKINSTHFTAIPAGSATTPHKFGEGHYHLFLDVLPTAPGEVIPKTSGIYHTANSAFTIPDVGNGHHKLYVVLGYSDHTPYEHIGVVSARPHGAIAVLEFDVTGSNYTAPTVVPSPLPSQSTAGVPSAAPSTSAPSGGTAATVKVEFDATNSGKFDPSSVSAHVGDTVKWSFVDNQNNPHTVTSDDGSTFDSQAKGVTGNPGDTFSFTFTKAGTYAYHCVFHANMTGKVTVS
jgi:plastocyanin